MKYNNLLSFLINLTIGFVLILSFSCDSNPHMSECLDNDQDDVCDYIDECVGTVDECGVCNGDGCTCCSDDDDELSALGLEDGCVATIETLANSGGCEFNFPMGSETFISDFCPLSCGVCEVCVCDENLPVYNGGIPDWDCNEDGVLDNLNDYQNNGSITSTVLAGATFSYSK